MVNNTPSYSAYSVLIFTSSSSRCVGPSSDSIGETGWGYDGREAKPLDDEYWSYSPTGLGFFTLVSRMNAECNAKFEPMKPHDLPTPVIFVQQSSLNRDLALRRSKSWSPTGFCALYLATGH
jgi:hypothetical protein